MPLHETLYIPLSADYPGVSDRDAGEPAHGADEAHDAHYNDTSADHPAFPFVGHDFFSWLA